MAHVLTDLRDGVAWLTLNTPEERNTLTAPMVAEITAAMDAFEADESVGAVVVTGAGSAFCAGANLGNLRTASRASLANVYEGFLRIARSPLPTLAAVNGPAVGAGMNLALGCDVRIAAERARFDTRFLQIGLHPGGGHTWMQRRIVGPQAAMAAVVFGQVLDGREAERVGLVYRCVPDADLLDAAQSFAAGAATRARDHRQADDPRHGRHRRTRRGGRTRARTAALDRPAAVVRGAHRRAPGEDLEEVTVSATTPHDSGTTPPRSTVTRP
jgi:enoyl-CoA hydratase